MNSTHAGLGLTLVVIAIYGAIAATLQYHVSKQQVDKCVPYTHWMQPTVLGLAVDLVIFCLVLLMVTRHRKTHRTFLVLSTLVAVAGLAISSMHMSQVFDNLMGSLGPLWRKDPAKKDCPEPSSEVKKQLQWTSASMVAVFALAILMCFSWYINGLVGRHIKCPEGTVVYQGEGSAPVASAAASAAASTDTSTSSSSEGMSESASSMGGGCPMYDKMDVDL